VRREELEEMRREGLSPELRREFADAQRAVDEWERGRPRRGLSDLLDWVDELRGVFGEPAVDRRPWKGNDFRL
jgi:hypothetical protein